MSQKLNILIIGEGGQGVQKIGEILARAAFSCGFKSAYIPNFTVQQRGGVSSAFVKIYTEPIIYPKFKYADCILALSNCSVKIAKNFSTRDTRIIYNSSLAKDESFKEHKIKYKEKIAIPATDLAKKISERTFNIIMLGKIISEIKIIDFKTIQKELEEIFKDKYKKNQKLKAQNNQALKAGHEN